MDKPETIIEDLVRDQSNKKNGNVNIKQWFQALNKIPVTKKEEDEKYSLSKKVVELNDNDDEDINMLGEDFEVEPEKDIDAFEEDI
jgi:hypothetical protein